MAPFGALFLLSQHYIIYTFYPIFLASSIDRCWFFLGWRPFFHCIINWHWPFNQVASSNHFQSAMGPGRYIPRWIGPTRPCLFIDTCRSRQYGFDLETRFHRIQRDLNPGPLSLESNTLPSELPCFGYFCFSLTLYLSWFLPHFHSECSCFYFNLSWFLFTCGMS